MKAIFVGIAGMMVCSVASFAQQTKARTFDQCVQLAKQRGYTSSDRDMGDPNSAVRRFVANCMAGRQK
jgi:hypothetical protein